MDKLINVLAKITLLLFIYVLGFYTCVLLQPEPVATNEHAIVKAVCDYGHSIQNTNGESEEACGKALDASGTIYLCNNEGNNCWVEQNSYKN